MFQPLTVAILMVGLLMATAGPLKRTCNTTTGSGGETIETCREVGYIGRTYINRTDTNIRAPGISISNNSGGSFKQESDSDITLNVQ